MEKQPISSESKAIKKVRKPWRLPTFAGGIGLSLMLASEVACAHEPTTPTKNAVTPVPSSAEAPTWLIAPTPNALSLETSTPEYIELLSKYYPELLRSDLSVRGKVSVAKDSTSTTILNYTEYQLNVNSTFNVYDILERSARDSQAKIDYPLNDTKRIFVLRPKQEVKSRTILLIPANAPMPTSWQARLGIVSEHPAATISVTEGVLSYAQATTEGTNELFTSFKQVATKNFATEACQQIVKTAVLDTDGTEIKDPGETNLAQEIFCNSFGIAIAARLLGITYDRYYTFAKTHALDIKSEYEYALIPFDRFTYSQFPITGGILK